jgi:WD40 repeat protein/serine/threonine protein kinase
MSQLKLQSSLDAAAALLVEELIDKLQAGEADVEAFLAAHPEHTETLQRLLPALRVLADLSNSQEEECRSGASDLAPLGELGDFHLIREVGRGGMGVVYEAEQISLHRRVALKMLPLAAALETRQLQRFRNEAVAAASLHHEHIIPVHAVGCERGIHFYVMQFVEGCTLAELIRALQPEEDQPAPDPAATQDFRTDGQSPTLALAGLSTECSQPRGRTYYRRVAEWMVQAAEALEHAHGLGIVHRDIKPGNLLLDQAGKLWVGDFGLARFGADAGLTMSGDLVGTLRYMSPEQALAKRVVIDHRTDVYSLGATLYELLTLRPVFPGIDRQEVLRQITFEEPLAPRRLDTSIPLELETIVLKALAKTPDERYATAQKLAEDLRRFQDDKPILARRPSLVERVRKWAHRHKGLVRAALAAGVLTVVLSVTSALIIWQKMQETNQAKAATDMESALKTQALGEKTLALADKTAMLAEKEWALYRTRIALADRNLVDGNSGAAEALLDACPLEHRRWEWHFLKRLCHIELLDLPSPPVDIARGLTRVDLAFSSDGQRLVSVSSAGIVTDWAAATGRKIHEFKKPELRDAFLSPDGQRVGALNKDGGAVWDTASDKQLLTLSWPRNGDRLVTMGWQADGRPLAICSSDGKVTVWDTVTGQEICTLSAKISRPVFDGQRVAGMIEDLSVKVWAVDKGEAILTLKLPETRILQTLALSKNFLAVETWGGIQLWDTTTGHLLCMLPGQHPVFSPDGQRLAYNLPRGGIKVWDLNPLREGFTIPAVTGASVFSPDGRRLACSGVGRIQVFDATNPPYAVIVRGTSRPCRFVALSPDGRHAAFLLPANNVTIVDIKSGQTVHSLRRAEGEGVALCASYSPDGHFLAAATGLDAKVWDTHTGQLLKTLRGPSSVFSVAYSPEGGRLATGGADGIIKVWAVATGQELLTLRGHTDLVGSVAFSPDGGRLVSGTVRQKQLGHELKVWDLQTGREVLGLPPEADEVSCVTFSPDGRRIFACWSGTVKVWDAATGQELHNFGASPPRSRILALSPDGQRMATWNEAAGRVQDVKIWDVPTGEEVLTLPGLQSQPTALAFSRDGTHLAASFYYGRVMIWDATPWQAPPGSDPAVGPGRAAP